MLILLLLLPTAMTGCNLWPSYSMLPFAELGQIPSISIRNVQAQLPINVHTYVVHDDDDDDRSHRGARLVPR